MLQSDFSIVPPEKDSIFHAFVQNVDFLSFSFSYFVTTKISCKNNTDINNCTCIFKFHQSRCAARAWGIPNSKAVKAFKGLTFVASTGISILAAGDEDAKASFFDCEWSGHVGLAVVQIQSESDIPGSDGGTLNRTFDKLRSQNSSSAEKGRLRSHRNGKRVLKSLPDLRFEPSSMQSCTCSIYGFFLVNNQQTHNFFKCKDDKNKRTIN